MRDESQRRPDGPDTDVPEIPAERCSGRPDGPYGPSGPDTDGERRAVAAFRAARDEGAHAPVPRWRRRRRDDWRPAQRRRGTRPVRGMLGGALAAALLGGVAVAAGSGALPTPFGDDGPGPVRPTPTSPATPGPHRTGEAPPPPDDDGTRRSTGPDTGPTNIPGGPRSSDRARNVAALCRVYLEGRGNGRAMDATAFERLEAAAGGASEAAVTAYCAALPERPSPRGTNRGQGERNQRNTGNRPTAPEDPRNGPDPSRTGNGENGNAPGTPGAPGTTGAGPG
ncbi:hypothetical protein ACFYXP_16515 [Streptomyces sp. NPDC002466]|uniref:hypothetical protein n=1 Tax=unclassified Streptomyces TaxID=2593676 RepID=UPI0033283C39